MDETSLQRARTALNKGLTYRAGGLLWGEYQAETVSAILEHLEMDRADSQVEWVKSADWQLYRQEKQERERAGQPPHSESSSAPTTGPVNKPYGSPLASQAYDTWLYQMTERISALCRLMGFTEPEWGVTLPDSSTLKLTLRWPTDSGSIPDGFPGHVSLDHPHVRFSDLLRS